MLLLLNKLPLRNEKNECDEALIAWVKLVSNII